MTPRSLQSCRPDFRHAVDCPRLRAPVRALGWLLLAAALLQSAPSQAQNPTFSISIRDNAFDPPELTVPVGQKIELHVTNERTSASEFESAELRREKIVTPGQQVTVYVGPLRPGTYEFFDDFNPQTRGHLIAR
jgi:heme/copper-type cytochrome/quinol oxidase subunit 2